MKSIAMLFALLVGSAAFAAESPTAATTEYLEAQREYDWAAMARSLRPAELRRFRTVLSTPMANFAPDWATLFPGRSEQELAAMGDVEFVAELLPRLKLIPRIGEFEVLGVVHDGLDTAYVVVKVDTFIGERKQAMVEAYPVAKDEGEWRAGLPMALASIVMMFEVAAETAARELPEGLADPAPVEPPLPHRTR